MKILQIASGDFFSTYGGGQIYVKNIVDEWDTPTTKCNCHFFRINFNRHKKKKLPKHRLV